MDSLELVQIRLIPDKKLYSDKPIRNAEDACKILADEMKLLDRETVAVLAMNSQNQILSASFCSIGTLCESVVAPREVFKSCILQNAASCNWGLCKVEESDLGLWILSSFLET